MLDLKKYTQFCILADKIEFLEMKMSDTTNPSASYAAELRKYQGQYNRLYREMSGKLDLPINLDAYVHNILQYLNKDITNIDEKWMYRYQELMYKKTESEHFYGYHTYHDYKYQVELVRGDVEEIVVPVCTVNRELSYHQKDAKINMLHDHMYAPFSLRLDETTNMFDEQTCKDLKNIYFKTYIQGQQAELDGEMTLIQQEIKRLRLQYQDKNRQYQRFNKQLQKLGNDNQNVGCKK